MPPLNNTLQTLPAENRLQIHAAAASIAPQPRILTILGSKLLQAHKSGEYNGILPVQFANAAVAVLHPLSATCRKLYIELPPLITAAPYPFTYRCVVQNFDLDQLDLFRAFMDSPNNCSRDFRLKIQFDSGVLASALELERRVTERRADADEQRRQGGVFRCEITRFILDLGLERGRKVLGGGGEGDSRAMTESQARDTVQVLRRVRLLVNGNDRHSTLFPICKRFEAMVDVYVARSKGRSNVCRVDGLPDAHPERAKADEEIERKKRCQAAEQAKHLETETVKRRKAKALARFFCF